MGLKTKRKQSPRLKSVPLELSKSGKIIKSIAKLLPHTFTSIMSSSSTARSTLSLRKRQPAKLANLAAKCSSAKRIAKPSSKLRPLMSSSIGRLTRSRKRQQAFDSLPAVKLAYPRRPKAAPTGKTARHLSIIANESSNSLPLDQRFPTTTGIRHNLSTATSDETSVIMNEINSISSNDWDVLDDIVHDSFGGMEAVDLSLEFTIGAHLEYEDLSNCLRRARISTRTITPTAKPSQEAPLLHTPHYEQQINEELEDDNIQLREVCELSEKESEHNREASSLTKHDALEAKVSLVSPEKQRINMEQDKSKTDMELDDVSKQLQQANKLLEEYHELRNQEREDKQETSSLKRQCDELEAQLSSVTEQLQQAKKLLEKHEQETSYLKKQCNELKAKISSVIMDPKTRKRENKSLSKTVAEDEISCLRSAQEKAGGYRQDMSNAKSAFEFISTECEHTRNTLSVEKQVQDLRELVNEKNMKLMECRERCKNRHQPWRQQPHQF